MRSGYSTLALALIFLPATDCTNTRSGKALPPCPTSFCGMKSLSLWKGSAVPKGKEWIDSPGSAPVYQVWFDQQGRRLHGNMYNRDGSLLDSTRSIHTGNGDTLQEIRYNADGTIFTGWSQTYRSPGLVAQRLEYSSGGNVTLRTEFLYDTCNFLIGRTMYHGDSSLSSYRTYENDENGNRIHEIRYNADSLKMASVSYTYDNQRRLVEELWRDGRGSPNTHRKLTYHANGNKATERHLFADGSTSMTRTYNESGDLLSECGYAPDSTIHEQIRRQYHQNGRLASRTRFSGARTTSREVFDEYGLIRKSTTFAPDGSIHQENFYSYEIDERGNWTTARAKYPSSEKWQVDRREIEYW